MSPFSLIYFQRVFEENRNAEVVEMQRLEEQERRRREEKVSARNIHDSLFTLWKNCAYYF